VRSPWPVRVLLPAAQVVAEGSWLAVLYAALQALFGSFPQLGPIELGAMAWAGMAWGRRRRWTSTGAEAVGLPLLALLAGAFGWLLDPSVRNALAEGNLTLALSLHGAGWLGALAFWRGEAHRSREDDDLLQERLLRWAVPGLAVPWLIGHAAATGAVEDAFTAAAFVGTVFFIGSAFTAMGLARLEAVRLATGSDWRGNRSWLFMVIGLAMVLTVLVVPTALFLGIPARSLLTAMVGPLNSLLFLLVVLASPIFLLAAVVADAIHPLLPEGFGQFQLTLPSVRIQAPDETSPLPAIIFYAVVGSLLAFELFVLVVMVLMRVQERRRMRDAADVGFEERSIVVPPSDERRPPPVAPAVRRARPDAGDPVGAYLTALDALQRDGRWPRGLDETPAGHAARASESGLGTPALGRLAAAYQLARYGGRPLAGLERGRARARLTSLRAWLRHGQDS
jgi:hypothetical protein